MENSDIQGASFYIRKLVEILKWNGRITNVELVEILKWNDSITNVEIEEGLK